MSSKLALSPIRRAWYKWKSLRWVPGRKRFLVGLDLQGNTFWEFHDALSPSLHNGGGASNTVSQQQRQQPRMRRIARYPPSTPYSEIRISPQWHQWLRHTRRDAPSLAEQAQDVVRQEQLKVLAAAADARWAGKKGWLDAPDSPAAPAIASQMEGEGEGRRGVSPLTSGSGVSRGGAYAGEQEAAAAGEGGGRRRGGGEEGDEIGRDTTIHEQEARTATAEPPPLQTQRQDRVVEGDEVAPGETRHHPPSNQEHSSGSPGAAKQRPAVEDSHADPDPWKRTRGGPSEQWQPAAWDGRVAPRRR